MLHRSPLQHLSRPHAEPGEFAASSFRVRYRHGHAQRLRWLVGSVPQSPVTGSDLGTGLRVLQSPPRPGQGSVVGRHGIRGLAQAFGSRTLPSAVA